MAVAIGVPGHAGLDPGRINDRQDAVPSHFVDAAWDHGTGDDPSWGLPRLRFACHPGGETPKLLEEVHVGHEKLLHHLGLRHLRDPRTACAASVKSPDRIPRQSGELKMVEHSVS